MSALSPARPAERLLETASRLFALQGIRAVGIDQIIAEAGVAKSSLYQAFGSKEALVVAYLERQDSFDRAAYRAAATGVPSGPGRVLLSFDLACVAAQRRNFRGCLYLNALTEFPDPRHPVAEAVETHRVWVRARWAEALSARGGDGAALVERVQVVYDGGVAGVKTARSTASITLARSMVADLLAAGGHG
ncbi:TetR family transcriptional regulator [Planotetraspora thailandica]|uniref:TetR family transcriptional regulator n=1 Tax=Planotetraspora thailandica TaxID=487172 RepID=A0A8J3Y1V0_9ACTN|nr:TetR/AcrR family transcriptional regulator [Planotetraspora thailandica]GII59216.1 TetR family transcriptional regulator [Planotetraspora thailandica]